MNPWDIDVKNHPEIEYKFEYKNYECKVRRNQEFKTWYGYTTLPNSHPFYNKHHNKDYDELKKIDVHGSLTYGLHGTFGFDTAHVEDIIPGLLFRDISDKSKHYWTFDEVVEETKRMVDQFIVYE